MFITLAKQNVMFSSDLFIYSFFRFGSLTVSEIAQNFPEIFGKVGQETVG